MTSACPVWEIETETHQLKLQRMHNKILRATGDLPRGASVRDMHAAFHIPHVYDYITELCRQPARVIHNSENDNVRNIGQGEARHRNYKRLKLDGGYVYGRLSD
jgi:hypothetical protein